MSSKLKFSSRPVIAGIFILFILLLAAGGWFYYRGLKSTTLEKNYDYLSSLASAKGKAVTVWFQKEENLLRDYFRGNPFYEKRRGKKASAVNTILNARLNSVLTDINAVSCALYNSKEKLIGKAGSEANTFPDVLPALPGKTSVGDVISIERIKEKTYAEAIIPLQRMRDDNLQSAYAVVRISLEPLLTGDVKQLPGYYSSEEAALYSPAQAGSEWLLDVTTNKFYNASFISEKKAAGGSLFNSMIEGINIGTDQKNGEVISSAVKIGGSAIFLICKANISDLEEDVKTEGTKLVVFIVSVSLMLCVLFIYLFTGKKKTSASVKVKNNIELKKKEPVKDEDEFDASEIQNDYVFEVEKNAEPVEHSAGSGKNSIENKPAETETVEIVEPAEPATAIPAPEDLFVKEENEIETRQEVNNNPEEDKAALTDDEIIAAIAGVMENKEELPDNLPVEEKAEDILTEMGTAEVPAAEEVLPDKTIEESVAADELPAAETTEVVPVHAEEATVKVDEPAVQFQEEIVQEEIKEETPIIEEEIPVLTDEAEQAIPAVEEIESEREPEVVLIEAEKNEAIISEEISALEEAPPATEIIEEVIQDAEPFIPVAEQAETVIEPDVTTAQEIPVSEPYKELEDVEIARPGISKAIKESFSESEDAVDSTDSIEDKTEEPAPLFENEPEQKEEIELVEGKLDFIEKPFTLTEYQKPKREITSKLDGVKGFGLIPKILFEINLLLKREPDNRNKLASVIIKEQSLTTKLLAVANSPYYGLKKKVTSIEYALLLLGTDEVCRLVTALSLSDAVRFPSTPHLRYLDYWYHSMVVGFTARDIASKLEFHEIVNDVFLGGIFHDLGIQILAKYFPKEFEAIAAKILKGDNVLAAELETVGSTHQEIGRYAAERWGLPDVIFDAIAFHHSPAKSESGKVMAGIINIADWMVHQVTNKESFWDSVVELDADNHMILGFKSIEERNTFLEDYYPALHATLGAIRF